MGQREPYEWDDVMLVWGEDAGLAWAQQQTRARLLRGEGRSLIKAEQWAALDAQGLNDPLLARQYDRFQSSAPRCQRGQ